MILKIRCVHQDHPRLRGEYPRRCPCLTKLSGSPPLARGILTDRARGRMENRITPACAGNTELKRESLNEGEDHPRLRGEYCVHQVRESRSPGSPPLARGIHHDRKTDRLDNRITPACAGNTYFPVFWLTARKDHPRLRGEYYRVLQLADALEGSPPLARGIQQEYYINKDRGRITPACAGNTGSY